MKIFSLALLALLGWFWLKPAPFDRFANQSFYEMVRTDPEALTNLGLSNNAPFDFYSGKLTDVSSTKIAQRLNQARKIQSRLKQFDRAKLTLQQQLTYDILSLSLDEVLASASFDYGINETGNTYNPYPVNQLFGVQNTLPDFLVNMHQVSDKRSAARYVSRLKGWDKKFTDVIADLKTREEHGVVLPRFLIDKVLAECKGFIAKPAKENMLVTSFRTKMEEASLSPSAVLKL